MVVRKPTRSPITYRPKNLSLVEAKIFDCWVKKFVSVAGWGITYFRMSEHWVKKSVTLSGETGGTILDRWVIKLSAGWDKTWSKLFDRGVEMLVVRFRKLFLFWITVQRALPWPPNKLSHLTTTCNYVNLTTHATVFNLQPCELCKESWL